MFWCSGVLHCVAEVILKGYILEDTQIARYTTRPSGTQESLASNLRHKPKHDRPALSGLNPIMETDLKVSHRRCLSIIRNNKEKIHFNLLKPTGRVMHQQFNIQKLYVLSTMYLCVL